MEQTAASRKLMKWANSNSYRVAYGPVEALHLARDQVLRLYSGNSFQSEFFADRLSWLEESLVQEDWRIQSVVVVAVPRPFHLLRFNFEREEAYAVLPPTYVDYETLPERILASLPASLQNRLKPLRMPVRAVAALLGLIRFGRNNLGYIDGLGSYFQLCGYVSTDRFHDRDSWRASPHQKLEACDKCRLCQTLCPVEAIPSDRYLLRAERCITYHNESPQPWPSWLPTWVHNSLMGCYLCQLACPLNDSHLQLEPPEICFTEEETHALLGQSWSQDSAVEEGICRKLSSIGIDPNLNLVGRNLQACLEDRRGGGNGGDVLTHLRGKLKKRLQESYSLSMEPPSR